MEVLACWGSSLGYGSWLQDWFECGRFEIWSLWAEVWIRRFLAWQMGCSYFLYGCFLRFCWAFRDGSCWLSCIPWYFLIFFWQCCKVLLSAVFAVSLAFIALDRFSLCSGFFAACVVSGSVYFRKWFDGNRKELMEFFFFDAINWERFEIHKHNLVEVYNKRFNHE